MLRFMFAADGKMPRSSSVAPRAALQTSTSLARTVQKRLSSSRPAMFADSPKAKAAVEPSAATVSMKNDLNEVPDSPPMDSQSVYILLFVHTIKNKQTLSPLMFSGCRDPPASLTLPIEFCSKKCFV